MCRWGGGKHLIYVRMCEKLNEFCPYVTLTFINLLYSDIFHYTDLKMLYCGKSSNRNYYLK